MTNPDKVTLVPIAQRFDADGKPSCDRCPMNFRYYQDVQECGQHDSVDGQVYNERNTGVIPGPKCPIHNPQETKEPL